MPVARRATDLFAPDGSRLDRIDLKILHRLQVDARITNHDLAREIGLSDSATLHRVRRLEASRSIRSHCFEVDPEIFAPWVMFLAGVELSAAGRADRAALIDAIRRSPQVLDAWGSAERQDLLLKVALPKLDAMPAFQDTIDPGGQRIHKWRWRPMLERLKGPCPHPLLIAAAEGPDQQGSPV